MLFYPGMILIMIQLGLDYLTLLKGKPVPMGLQDLASHYLFALIGIGLLWLNHLWQRHRIRTYREQEEDELE